MAERGRRGATEPFTDTLARKSAEQATLLKQDIILEALREIRDAADLGAAQTALAALDLTAVELKN